MKLKEKKLTSERDVVWDPYKGKNKEKNLKKFLGLAPLARNLEIIAFLKDSTYLKFKSLSLFSTQTKVFEANKRIIDQYL